MRFLAVSTVRRLPDGTILATLRPGPVIGAWQVVGGLIDRVFCRIGITLLPLCQNVLQRFDDDRSSTSLACNLIDDVSDEIFELLEQPFRAPRIIRS